MAKYIFFKMGYFQAKTQSCYIYKFWDYFILFN